VLIRYTSDSKGHPVQKAVVYTKTEHCIPKNLIDPDAIKIISHLRDFGYDAYLVGGAVRDLILGNSPKDFDIVTNAEPQAIKRLFRNSRIIGKRFRLVHIFYGSKIFEVSTFRSTEDGSIGNKFGTIDEDVRRRDFSLNALYYDPIKEQVIDYVNGFEDIKKHIVKPVIPLNRIFIEDPVRMIRAIKYASQTGFKMSFGLMHKIKKSAYLLSPVSPSRLTEEMLKILNSTHASKIVEMAMDSGIYMYLQPQAAALMLEKKDFALNYLNHLKELESFNIIETDARLGDKLYYIIFDFIASLTDWTKEFPKDISFTDLYNKTWTFCRQFIMPMNPQRTELEFAIKLCLKKLGIKVKNKIKSSGRKTVPEEKLIINPIKKSHRHKSASSAKNNKVVAKLEAKVV
jgi:poly(A) polymerase